MPLVKTGILQGNSSDYKRAVLDGVRKAVVDAVQVPDSAVEQFLYEIEPANSDYSPGKTRQRVIIEITLFQGRSLEVKRELYQTIAQTLAESPGIKATDITIVLYEIPRENWS